MSVRTPSQAPIPTPASEPPPYPWRVGLALLAAVLLLGGVFYGATQLIKTSASSDQARVAPTETAIAQAMATAAVPTRTSVPQATMAPQAAPAARPTAAPTIATGAAQAAPATTAPGTARALTSVPTSLPTTAATPAPTAPPTAVTAPVAFPVDQALEQEVSAAYLHYFDVRTQALFTNDPTGLDAVADGPPLSGLEQDIVDQRAEGKALATNVVHHFNVVRLQGEPDDEVSVIDHYRDLSYWVNPNTREPLPGQTVPSTEDEAPVVNAVYHLRNIDGVWKVVGGERYDA